MSSGFGKGNSLRRIETKLGALKAKFRVDSILPAAVSIVHS
jgi:hypothetical protein